MENTTNMTEGKPLKILFSFALPLMLGNIFQQMYTVTDTAIVGKGVGLTALAAIGTVDWLNWMFLSIAQGFSQGFCVRISQKYGEGNKSAVKHLIGQSAVLTLILSVIVVTIAQIGLPLFMKLLRVPDELYHMAELYTRILASGLIAVFFYNYASSVLRAVGNSKTPLWAMIIASVTNIVLDCVTVFIFDWGIAGAAGATFFSQCVACLICILKLINSEEFKPEKSDLKKDFSSKSDLLKLGAPITFKNIIISFGGMAVQAIVNGFAMSFIAGFTATNKLYGLLEIAAISYGYAVSTYVGQNYGAMKYDRIKSGMKSAVKLSIITSLIIAAVMIVFGREITMIFISTDDPITALAASDTAYLFLICMSVCLPILYLLYVHQAALQGMGYTYVSMVSGSIEFVLRVGIGLIVGFSGFENGIFASEVLAWVGAEIYMFIKYQRTLKQDEISLMKNSL